MIGGTISHYKILEKLGEGGMGVVYKAEDTKLERAVALKFLPPDLVRDEDIRKRFEHEAKAAAVLDHANICTIFEIDEVDDQTFIAMAYVEGQTLKERHEAGPLEIKELISLAIQVASGLGVAHGKGIAHRDIKPANIMVTPEGQAKIMDFGVAKSARLTTTQTGSTLGTVSYMSPEQARGDDVDYRTDIWSLGVVLYEMVTGQRPFKGDYEQAIIYAIVNEDPLPPMTLRGDVPSGLDRIILRALAKNLDKRYSSTREMIRDLQALKDRTDAAPPTDRLRKGSWRRWIPFLTALVVIVSIGIAGVVVLRTDRSSSPTSETGAIQSLAVLPLENLSGDPDQEYFVDGMTEALITELSKIKALSVISRTSIMRYKDTDKSLPAIAGDLNVDAVVEGSAMLAGDRIRITAQLIEAETDRHLWAESYNRELRDILALQKEVARAVAKEIRITLTPEEETRLAGARPIDPEAHEAYLRGRFYANRLTVESTNKAIEYYERVITVEPEYALAYAGLANAYDALASLGAMDPQEAWPRVKAEAKKALAIDETVAFAHALLADVAFLHEWDWARADEEFRRSIDLDPNDSSVRHWYAMYLSSMGRHEEAVREAERAVELDPLSVTARLNTSAVLLFAGRWEEALEHAMEAVELDPASPLAHMSLGSSYLRMGRLEEAFTEIEKATELSGRHTAAVAYLAEAHAAAGHIEEARETLDEMLALSKERYVSPIVIAGVYAALGEKDEAFEWLEKAYRERSTHLPMLRVHPRLESLRTDPRFAGMVERMGLPPVTENREVDNRK